jgi:hypothetical protein
VSLFAADDAHDEGQEEGQLVNLRMRKVGPCAELSQDRRRKDERGEEALRSGTWEMSGEVAALVDEMKVRQR